MCLFAVWMLSLVVPPTPRIPRLPPFMLVPLSCHIARLPMHVTTLVNLTGLPSGISMLALKIPHPSRLISRIQ